MPDDVEPIVNRPRLLPHQYGYWEAFQFLQTSRPVGFGGIGYIPLSEILAYCLHYGITDYEERNDLIHCVKALDIEYVNIVSKQHEEERELREQEAEAKKTRPEKDWM